MNINLTITYEELLKIQNILCADIIQKIFERDWEHYNNKWVNSNFNLLTFLSMLDHQNLNKIFDWYKSNNF